MGGGGNCAGGSKLSDAQIDRMKEITLQAKATYMREYREKARGPNPNRLRKKRRRRSENVDGEGEGEGDIAGGEKDAADAAEGGEGGGEGETGAGEAECDGTPDTGFIAGFVVERTTCPVEGCGKTWRSRNLLEHMSSKTCRGGHLLTVAQLKEVKELVKNARSRERSARKPKVKRGRLERGSAGADGGLFTDLGGSAPVVSVPVLDGAANETSPLGVSPEGNSTAAGSHLSTAALEAAAKSSLLSGPLKTDGGAAAPGSGNGHAASAVDADNPVLSVGIDTIGEAMAKVVTRGFPEDEKVELEKQIIDGVEGYKLTALVLCAARPASEDLAHHVLSRRVEKRGTVEGGVFWAVVEFIERSRRGELETILKSLS